VGNPKNQKFKFEMGGWVGLGGAAATGYHRPVKIQWAVFAEWLYALLLGALCWVAASRPGWAPIVAAAAIAIHRLVDRYRSTKPWSDLLVVISTTTFLLVRSGWELALGWLLLGALIVAVARALPRRDGGRLDAADLLAVAGWGAVFALTPHLVETENGGWLAPLLLLYAARRVARTGPDRAAAAHPGPPSREVRGTLSLNNVVVSGADALPQSVPINLELRAGDSLAVLCDSPLDAATLAAVFSGRRTAHSGQMMVDGSQLEGGGRLAAVVALGEAFVVGDLLENLSALTDRTLDRSALAAIHEACSLNEVVEALGDRLIEGDGSPLTPYHRLLVLAARVIPSSYRIVVVVDPMPWVNPVRGELWRAAVVRASVGRTSIWLTPDRELATRASHVVEYRQGALRTPDRPLD
jgi:predicted ABC-type transport system involved in lysophospholipase L1 biosynthesis ATPase subunit